MANLFDSLRLAGGALQSLQSALETSQNNIANGSTAGFARQRLRLEALSADPLAGLPGGVRTAGLHDSRSLFAESTVWRELHSGGYHGEMASGLSQISARFEVSAGSGIPAGLNRFFQAASFWSVAPESTIARQDFLRAAAETASSFREAADGLSRLASLFDSELNRVAGRINAHGEQLAGLHGERLRSANPDAGLDARIFAALEQLSELADFTTLNAPDGSITVLLGGQVPLVLGDQAQAVDPRSSTVTSGQLGGLLAVRDRILPTAAADLDRLAGAFAGRVNEILGQPLYTWTPPSSASTLGVNPDLSPAAIPAATPGPPPTANGIPLGLAALAESVEPADRIDGATFVEFYGAIGGRIGGLESAARAGALRDEALAVQARKFREEISGVALDQEAVSILQYQRGYQAAAQMVRVIDELAEALIRMIG